MSVFPILLYTSAREILTLLYTYSLKKVLLSGGASHSVIHCRESPSPPGTDDRLGEWTVERFIFFR